MTPALAPTYEADERHHSQRRGLDPQQRKEALTTAWQQSDSAAAFINAAADQGFVIAHGDRRAFVVVDQAGEVHSLPRQVQGVRAREIKARLGDVELPTVAEVQAKQSQHELTDAFLNGAEKPYSKPPPISRTADGSEGCPQADNQLDLMRERRQIAVQEARGKLAELRSQRAALTKPSLRNLWRWMTGQAGAVRREIDQEIRAREDHLKDLMNDKLRLTADGEVTDKAAQPDFERVAQPPAVLPEEMPEVEVNPPPQPQLTPKPPSPGPDRFPYPTAQQAGFSPGQRFGGGANPRQISPAEEAPFEPSLEPEKLDVSSQFDLASDRSEERPFEPLVHSKDEDHGIDI